MFIYNSLFFLISLAPRKTGPGHIFVIVGSKPLILWRAMILSSFEQWFQTQWQNRMTNWWSCLFCWWLCLPFFSLFIWSLPDISLAPRINCAPTTSLSACHLHKKAGHIYGSWDIYHIVPFTITLLGFCQSLGNEPLAWRVIFGNSHLRFVYLPLVTSTFMI